jgi:hypothetical protein
MHAPCARHLPTTATHRFHGNSPFPGHGGNWRSIALREKGETAMSNKAFDVNPYYLTLDSYQIDPRYLERRAKLGSGIDLRNPLDPRLRPRRAFKPPEEVETRASGLPVSSDTINEHFIFREGKGGSREASDLSAYFKASYGLNSVEGAYQRVREEMKGYHTVYALLEHSGEREELPESSLHWANEPESESIEDEQEALELFLQKYGSHYVSQIKYGLRIGIQGSLSESQTVSQDQLSASFKAAFGAFSAEGGASYEHRKQLNSWGVDLVLEVTSGGSNLGLLPPMRSLDEISGFLERVGKGEIQFSVAPIELSLNSYWETFELDWKTRDLLEPHRGFEAPAAQFGVPPGTILAWRPTPEYLRNLEAESEEKTIEPPPGWAICNGEQGTPDLTERFILGTATWEEVGQTGGTAEHGHGIGQKRVAAISGMVTAGTEAAQDVWWSPHIPPYVKVVYIMKL